MTYHRLGYNKKNNIRPIIIDQKGLEKLLANINPSKASGPDNIPNRILKECAIPLAPILKTILQCSLDTGELPKEYLQKRRRTPTRKLQASITNISHLQNTGTHHLQTSPKTPEEKKDTNKFKPWFQIRYSCETQLITTINDFLQEHDKGQQVDISILDFSKAFDTLPHDKLLHKREQYGIKGNINSWLTNFLSTRTMRTIVEGESSKETSVDSGVPQGTVLGPIMFLCHINDLPD